MRNPSQNYIYTVQELFYTFQGEGVHMGRAAFFVRLMGCDQECKFCDSAATWHRDWKPLNAQQLTTSQIVQRVVNYAVPGAFVVVTGGEPTLYNLTNLTSGLHDAGFKVHLETAGHRPLTGSFDWIALSPKTFATPPLTQNLRAANEFKLVVTDEARLRCDLECVLPHLKPGCSVWLHPEWSQRDNMQILNLITSFVKQDPRLRAGYQMHKLYIADLLDPKADRRIIPLGGRS